MDLDFKRIVIVNRGEPAVRLIHAVRELNRERDLGLQTVALYTDLDRNAKFVREADDAVFLGPATSRTSRATAAAATSTTSGWHARTPTTTSRPAPASSTCSASPAGRGCAWRPASKRAT